MKTTGLGEVLSFKSPPTKPGICNSAHRRESGLESCPLSLPTPLCSRHHGLQAWYPNPSSTPSCSDLSDSASLPLHTPAFPCVPITLAHTL